MPSKMCAMTRKTGSHVAYAAALLSAVGVVAIAGCSSPEPNVASVGAGTSTPSDPTSSPTTSSKDTACEADADCAVVETECCDHCNGGKVEAYRKEVAPSHKKAGCEQTMCTERGCGAASAVCKDKVCAVVIAPLDGPPVGS